MRLHRVHLRNYRGVIDNTVEFPSKGVTIIEGANERGKTCIPEAVNLILETLDTSRARRVRDAKPVHRDEVPEVEIEASTGDYRFVYRKRWLRRPLTVLTVTAPKVEDVTGRRAHERVRAILDETLDEDLWRALRMEQWTGADKQAGGFLPPMNIRTLVDALDSAVGGDLTGGGEDNLWRRICEERERYWTATGRVKAERNELQGSLEKAREKVADLRGRLEDMARDAARVAHLRSDRARLRDVREECSRTERELEEREAEAERLRGEVDRRAIAHQAAEGQKDRITGEQRRRRDLVRMFDSRSAELADLEAEARRAAPAIGAAVAHGVEAQTALEKAQAALGLAESDLLRARSDHDHHRALIDVDQLTERWERVLAAQTNLRRAESHLESATVDDDLVARIERAHLAVVAAEAAVQGAGARLEGTVWSEATMSIDGDQVRLVPGERIEKVVAEEMELLAPGVVRLRMKAGTDSRNLVTELARAREELARLCARGGVSDLPGARRAAARRKDAERDRQEAISAIRRDLRDLTPDLLREKVEGLRRRIDGYTADRAPDPPLPPTYEEAKRIAFEMEPLVTALRDRYLTCRADASFAARERQDREIDQATLKERIKNARSSHREAQRLVASAREQQSDSELSEELRRAQQRVDDAWEALQGARATLSSADPPSVQILLDNARAASRRAGEDLRRNEEEERELRAGLKLRGEEGLHTRLGEAERRLRRIQGEHRRLEAQARAAQLLHSRFAERRQQSRLRYHAPLTERIEHLGRIVFGAGFHVELGDDLQVARRTLDGVTLDVDQLSAGAREQLGLLSRLACAVIVSPDGGGAPVMIDDALGWSDPARLLRMGAAIAEAGRQCQIIILTCTPGRYAYVGDATVVRLPE